MPMTKFTATAAGAMTPLLFKQSSAYINISSKRPLSSVVKMNRMLGIVKRKQGAEKRSTVEEITVDCSPVNPHQIVMCLPGKGGYQ